MKCVALSSSEGGQPFINLRTALETFQEGERKTADLSLHDTNFGSLKLTLKLCTQWVVPYISNVIFMPVMLVNVCVVIYYILQIRLTMKYSRQWQLLYISDYMDCITQLWIS